MPIYGKTKDHNVIIATGLLTKASFLLGGYVACCREQLLRLFVEVPGMHKFDFINLTKVEYLSSLVLHQCNALFSSASSVSLKYAKILFLSWLLRSSASSSLFSSLLMVSESRIQSSKQVQQL